MIWLLIALWAADTKDTIARGPNHWTIAGNTHAFIIFYASNVILRKTFGFIADLAESLSILPSAAYQNCYLSLKSLAGNVHGVQEKDSLRNKSFRVMVRYRFIKKIVL